MGKEEFEEGQKTALVEGLFDKIDCDNQGDENKFASAMLSSQRAEHAQMRLLGMKREKKTSKAQRRALGNIHFIGQLFRHGLLTRKIIVECMHSLLRNIEDPDPEDVAAMCKLMTTVGQELE